MDNNHNSNTLYAINEIKEVIESRYNEKINNADWKRKIELKEEKERILISVPNSHSNISGLDAFYAKLIGTDKLNEIKNQIIKSLKSTYNCHNCNKKPTAIGVTVHQGYDSDISYSYN